MRTLLIFISVLAFVVGAEAQGRRLMLVGKAAAAGSSYDPATDAHIVRWWRAEGTVNTNAGNMAVTNWVERKGGISFTNRMAIANGPILSNNFVNGKAALRGFGTNVLLSAIGNFDTFTSLHFFIVIKSGNDSAVSNPGPWRYNGTDASTPYYPFGDLNVYTDIGTTPRRSAGNPTTSIDSWRLLEVVSTASEWTMRLDTTQEFTDGSNTVSAGPGSTPAYLFGIDETNSGQWTGDIAEILVSDQKETSTRLTDIRTYCDTQYNLAY